MDIINIYWSFEQYISVIWNDILTHYSISKTSVIVEVAPWEKTKLGVALSMYWFWWTLYVVEPRERVMNFIVEEYKKILPGATIIWVPTIFQNAAQYITSPVDAVFCNAILDDVIVSYSTPIIDFDTYYKEHFGSVEKSADTWANINEHYGDTTQRIVYDWKKLLDMIQPHTLIMSQYKSYFYETNNISVANVLPYDVLCGIKKLWENDFTLNSILEWYKQDPSRWTCIHYIK